MLIQNRAVDFYDLDALLEGIQSKPESKERLKILVQRELGHNFLENVKLKAVYEFFDTYAVETGIVIGGEHFESLWLKSKLSSETRVCCYAACCHNLPKPSSSLAKYIVHEAGTLLVSKYINHIHREQVGSARPRYSPGMNPKTQDWKLSDLEKILGLLNAKTLLGITINPNSYIMTPLKSETGIILL